MTLKDRIKKHEGCRLDPYMDSEGILTVGYGRNLEAVRFTQAEVDMMFETDFCHAKKGAELFSFYDGLNAVRRGVIIEMVFQMGRIGVGRFVKFIAAINDRKWHSAALEMVDSRWALQTPERARELAEIFSKG